MVHMALGDSATARFDAPTALREYQAAIALDSGSALAFAMASKTAVDLGESATPGSDQNVFYQQGESYARRAVALDSTSADNWFHLARALGRAALSKGVRERVRYAVEIRECALHALALNPDHPGALHVLGMWNAEVKRLNGFSLFFARRFLGGGILGKANWADARRLLEKAVALDPDRLSHHLDLAGIYASMGETDSALREYQFVLAATVQTDVNDPIYKAQASAALKRLR